jgi:hypothetical protein
MCLLEAPNLVDPGVNTTRSTRVVHSDSFIVRWGRADPDAAYKFHLISKIMLEMLCLKYNRNIHVPLCATACVYVQTRAPRLTRLI